MFTNKIETKIKNNLIDRKDHIVKILIKMEILINQTINQKRKYNVKKNCTINYLLCNIFVIYCNIFVKDIISKIIY